MNSPEAEKIGAELDTLDQEVKAQREVLLAENREISKLRDVYSKSLDALHVNPKSVGLQHAHDAIIDALYLANSRRMAVERTIQKLSITYLNLCHQQRNAARLSVAKPEAYES